MNASLVAMFNQWAREQGVDPAKLTHDNEPLNIVSEFPAKGKNVTLEFLQERVWWWRKDDKDHYREIFRQEGNKPWSDILHSLYEDRFLLSAYRYELMARCQSEPGYPFGCPWIWCSAEQRRMLECLWPNPWPAKYWLPSDKGKVEWVKLDWNFNLKQNDTVLLEQFEKEIARLRKMKRISRPDSGQGVRRKERSWRPVELMDLEYFHDDNLNDSERSHVSKARKSCQSFCREAGLSLKNA